MPLFQHKFLRKHLAGVMQNMLDRGKLSTDAVLAVRKCLDSPKAMKRLTEDTDKRASKSVGVNELVLDVGAPGPIISWIEANFFTVILPLILELVKLFGL